MTPYQALYGKPSPPSIAYVNQKSTNATLDQSLTDRDVTMNALKEHLMVVQSRMKKFADKDRRGVI